MSTPTKAKAKAKAKAKSTEEHKGVLLGYRILRDFSSDYNKKTPIYFVGIITEYQPSATKSSDIIAIFPSKKKVKELDNGLYRIRYLDVDIDEVSPAEAYAGYNLYNTYVGKVRSTGENAYFDREKFPNPKNHFLMRDLVDEERYYYDCYKDYLKEEKIDPVTLVVPYGEAVSEDEAVLTKFGYIAESLFEACGVKRFVEREAAPTPTKNKTPLKRTRTTPTRGNGVKTPEPVGKKARITLNSEPTTPSSSSKVMPMNVVVEDENNSKQEVAKETLSEEKKPSLSKEEKDISTIPPQPQDKSILTDEVTKKEPQEETKQDDTATSSIAKIEKELKIVNLELKVIDCQLDVEKEKHPDTANEIETVKKEQDEKYKNFDSKLSATDAVATTTSTQPQNMEIQVDLTNDIIDNHKIKTVEVDLTLETTSSSSKEEVDLSEDDDTNNKPKSKETKKYDDTVVDLTEDKSQEEQQSCSFTTVATAVTALPTLPNKKKPKKKAATVPDVEMFSAVKDAYLVTLQEKEQTKKEENATATIATTTSNKEEVIVVTDKNINEEKEQTKKEENATVPVATTITSNKEAVVAVTEHNNNEVGKP